MSHADRRSLAFSRIGRTQMSKAPIDLNALVKRVIAELQPEIESRKVEWQDDEIVVGVEDNAVGLANVRRIVQRHGGRRRKQWQSRSDRPRMSADPSST